METIVGTILIVAAIGLAAAILLLIASRVFAVEEDRRLAYLNSLLPGVNCGACGYAGCEQYAKAILKGAPTNACTPGGEVLVQEIAGFMGVDALAIVQKEAFVACKGTAECLKTTTEFEGEPSCRIFSTLYFSSLSCPFGCLGYGDCIASCQFDAIEIKDGIAVIDTVACTGCGACQSLCPRNLITIAEQGDYPTAVVVACKNTMPGAKTRKVCSVGCIACRKCAKACSVNAVTVENNVARIDTSLCTGCGDCLEACPTGSVSTLIYR